MQFYLPQHFIPQILTVTVLWSNWIYAHLWPKSSNYNFSKTFWISNTTNFLKLLLLMYKNYVGLDSQLILANLHCSTRHLQNICTYVFIPTYLFTFVYEVLYFLHRTIFYCVALIYIYIGIYYFFLLIVHHLHLIYMMFVI